jgi:hypothetical protein
MKIAKQAGRFKNLPDKDTTTIRVENKRDFGGFGSLRGAIVPLKTERPSDIIWKAKNTIHESERR